MFMRNMLVTFFLFICGCSVSKIKIKEKEVVFIEIYKMKNETMSFVRSINDRIKIKQIISCIEDSRQQMVKFIPKYKLVFHCIQEEYSVAVNDNAMSFRDGVKYKLLCNLEKFLE